MPQLYRLTIRSLSQPAASARTPASDTKVFAMVMLLSVLQPFARYCKPSSLIPGQLSMLRERRAAQPVRPAPRPPASHPRASPVRRGQWEMSRSSSVEEHASAMVATAAFREKPHEKPLHTRVRDAALREIQALQLPSERQSKTSEHARPRPSPAPQHQGSLRLALTRAQKIPGVFVADLVDVGRQVQRLPVDGQAGQNHPHLAVAHELWTSKANL
eukprot:scaffold652_cov260-Pinguiococcus_pyrenoidosus.AAC.14